jgi:ATP-dependent Lon protease
VRWIDKVLEIALERQPTPIVEVAPVPVAAAAAGDGAVEVVKH